MDRDDLSSTEDQLHSGVLEAAHQPTSGAAVKQSQEHLCRAYSVLIQADFQKRKLTDLGALLQKRGHNLEDLPVTVLLLWGVVAVELQAAGAARETLEHYLAALPPGLSRADAMAISRLYAVQLLAGQCQDFTAAVEWLEAGGAGLSYEQQELLLLEVDEAQEVLHEERLAQWAATQAAAAAVAGPDTAGTDADPAAGVGSPASVLLPDEAEPSEADDSLMTSSLVIDGTTSTSTAVGCSASAAADAGKAQPVDQLQPARSPEPGIAADDTLAAAMAVDHAHLQCSEAAAPAVTAASTAAVVAEQQQQQLQDSPYCTLTGIIDDEADSTPVVATFAAEQGTNSNTSSAGSTQAAQQPAEAGGSSDNSSSMLGAGCSSWLSSHVSSWWQSTPVKGALQALRLQDIPPWELAGGAAVAALVGYGIYRGRRRLGRVAADLAAGVVQTAQMGLGLSVVNAMNAAPSTSHRW